MRIVLLPPLFLPPAPYFKEMATADLAVIDTGLRFDKRNKQVHRTAIASAHGKAFLTVPVSHPESSRCSWSDVRISAHGEWPRVVRSTLATLFGPTPYFHLFKTDFFDIINESYVGRSVTDFDIALILVVRKLAAITTPLSVTLDSRFPTDPDVETVDLRNRNFYADGDEVSVIENLFRSGPEGLS